MDEKDIVKKLSDKDNKAEFIANRIAEILTGNQELGVNQ